MENCGAIAGTRRGGRDRHTDTVGLSQSQRQHQETEPEKVERDSGREEEEEDTCRCCDFQSQFSQNHRPGLHPQRFWERRKRRTKR